MRDGLFWRETVIRGHLKHELIIIRSASHAGVFNCKIHLRSIAMHLEQEFLEVEDNVRYILSDPRNRGKFVIHSIDLNCGHSGPFKRGQENSPESISHCSAKSPLEWLRREAAIGISSGRPVDFNALRHLKLG